MVGTREGSGSSYEREGRGTQARSSTVIPLLGQPLSLLIPKGKQGMGSWEWGGVSRSP